MPPPLRGGKLSYYYLEELDGKLCLYEKKQRDDVVLIAQRERPKSKGIIILYVILRKTKNTCMLFCVC